MYGKRQVVSRVIFFLRVCVCTCSEEWSQPQPLNILGLEHHIYKFHPKRYMAARLNVYKDRILGSPCPHLIAHALYISLASARLPDPILLQAVGYDADSGQSKIVEPVILAGVEHAHVGRHLVFGDGIHLRHPVCGEGLACRRYDGKGASGHMAHARRKGCVEADVSCSVRFTRCKSDQLTWRS